MMVAIDRTRAPAAMAFAVRELTGNLELDLPIRPRKALCLSMIISFVDEKSVFFLRFSAHYDVLPVSIL